MQSDVKPLIDAQHFCMYLNAIMNTGNLSLWPFGHGIETLYILDASDQAEAAWAVSLPISMKPNINMVM